MIFPALNCRISTNISEYSSITQFKLNVETRSFTAWRNSRGNINLLQHLNHWVENVIKQLVHTSAVCSSRYEALGKFGEHTRS